MIRILHLPGSVSLKDGRMHVIMNIYRHIDRSKVQFDFLAADLNDPSFVPEILALGGKVYLVPESKKNSFFILSKKLKEVLKNNNYTIIHYHATSLWASTLFSLKKYNIKKVIIHSHAPVYSDSRIKSIRNFIISIPMFFSGTNFIAVTRDAGKIFLHKKNFDVIPNSIDIDRFQYSDIIRRETRKSLGIDDRNIVIGNVGRISKQKNQLFLLDVFNEVIKNQNVGQWVLLLIGQDDQKNKLFKKIEALGLKDRVIILSTQPDIERYYSVMDLFCFPSTYEGFGMAALEAQSTGLSVILSDVIPEEVKLENTVQLSLNDPLEKWAQEVIKAVSMKTARSKGRAIVENAHFDSKNVAEKWLNVYLADGQTS